MTAALDHPPITLHVGDCLDVMRSRPDASVDLVFCSPPYEAARTYGIDVRESQIALTRRRLTSLEAA